MNMIRVALSH